VNLVNCGLAVEIKGLNDPEICSSIRDEIKVIKKRFSVIKTKKIKNRKNGSGNKRKN